MKRIGLLVGVLGGVLLLGGCDKVKRAAEDTVRETGEKIVNRADEGARKSIDQSIDSNAKKVDGDADSPDAKKRDKLKSDDDSDK